jgi:DNA-binding NarL/FixJ family response regulator
MKMSSPKPPAIRVALVESDPLRFVGFRAILESESDLELISVSLPEVATEPGLNLALLGDRAGQNLPETLSSLGSMRPGLPVLVVGPKTDDETILSAIEHGAKGYVFDGVAPTDLSRAIRTVSQGSVWASRRVLANFIELAVRQRLRMHPGANELITDREKQVLKMLVAGLSNKEIATPLGIEERTVKAHIAKMMRKIGVQNRIALSVHAITHSLVSSPAQ